MALIQNISRETLTLSSGAPVLSGAEANADLTQALEQAYLDAGLIAVVDPSAPANIPAAASVPLTGYAGTWDALHIYSPGQVVAYQGIAYACLLTNVNSAPSGTNSHWAAIFSGQIAAGQPNGVATLDGSGKLISSQVPAIAITDVHVVASDAAMLAISGAHQGTVAVRTDLSNNAFMNNGGTTGTDSDWTEIGFVDVVSVNGKQGVVVLASTDLSDSASLARLASPALTGTPTAPTAAPLTDTTQVATTAYADAAVAVEKSRAQAAEGNALQKASNLSDVASASAALGNLGGAPLASPALTGTPTAPTPATSDNSTTVATTAFVKANVPSVPVSSVFTRTGAVAAQAGDYTAAQVTNAADKSSAAQQNFTGEIKTPDLVVAGLTGATAATRYVGGTASGAPTSGTFAVGDFVIDQTGKVWICTTAGTPGTWTSPGAAPVANPNIKPPYADDSQVALALVNGSVYVVKIVLPVAETLTGVQFYVTAVGSSASILGSLYNASGSLVASSPLSAPVGGLNQRAFSSAYSAAAGVYYLGIQHTDTVSPASVGSASCFAPASIISGQGSSAPATITPPSGLFTSNTFPSLCTY